MSRHAIPVAAVLRLAKRIYGGSAPSCALTFFSSRRLNVVYEVDRQNFDLAKQFSIMTVILNREKRKVGKKVVKT